MHVMATLTALLLLVFTGSWPVARGAPAGPGTGFLVLNGQATGDHFGAAVLVVDLNRDRYGDLVIDAPRADPGGKPDAGTVYVFSGKTHGLLMQLNGEAAGDQFGSSLAACDVNRDRSPDLVVGAPFADPAAGDEAGSVYVYSGKDFKELRPFDGSQAGERAGLAVAGADLNKDKYGDVVVGAPYADRPVPLAIDAGRVTVYSGKGAAILRLWYGDGPDDLFGTRLACADLHRDKHGDVVASALAGDSPTVSTAGLVRAFSGKDGQAFRQYYGPKPLAFFGYSLACADVDGDRYPDILVGAPNANYGSIGNAGTLSIYSGQSGLLISAIGGQASGNRLGWSVACGDFDHDKSQEIIIGAPGSDADGPKGGHI